MVDESELRTRFADGATPAITIDTDAIISRSRSRRRPRQLAIGAVGLLAAASLVFAGVSTFPRTDLTSAGIVADEASTRAESDTGLDAPVDDSYLAPANPSAADTCGVLIPSTAASPYGLELTLDLPGPVPASGTAFGSVRLTNVSDEPVAGTTASAPDVNLISDGAAISHSPDAQILSVIPVNLQPGQSIEFAVSINIYDCTTIDAGGMLEPGIYTTSASLAFVPTEPEIGGAAEVRSSPSTIVLQ
ncbi:hypothetical protein [Salinibacterium sp. M195]|uniref:hypothetical protein n=1 Tax=Salinibacterium sp. M195 TaxID=2583374 RepID=UPI001C62609E|nr:hypothetical protein [Salinibacterium sp. M195]QYH36587.1 hypothetical protein FFT87_11875 [Salinibacterium sp. M195]